MNGSVKQAFSELKKRVTKSLVVVAAVGVALVAVAALLQALMPVCLLATVMGNLLLTLGASVFAACVVSVLFDLKGIRELIARSEIDVLLEMLLSSRELYSPSDLGERHRSILTNLRFKATAALHGIDLMSTSVGEEARELQRGHLESCLASLDRDVDDLYARDMRISRIIKPVEPGDGSNSKDAIEVFEVEETIEVHYANDAGSPQEPGCWNRLESGMLPAWFPELKATQLVEVVSVTVNEGNPSTRENVIICDVLKEGGVMADKRVWRNNWKEKGILPTVSAGDTCRIETKRTFYIPAKEEVTYNWKKARKEFRYDLSYRGDDCQPVISVIGCALCEGGRSAVRCESCDQEKGIFLDNSSSQKVAVFKDWVMMTEGADLKVTWQDCPQETSSTKVQ